MAPSLHSTIAQVRAERGETQEALANAVGVSRQTIIAIERGNYTPSVLLALKIARHVKRPVEQLFIIRTPR